MQRWGADRKRKELTEGGILGDEVDTSVTSTSTVEMSDVGSPVHGNKDGC